MDRKEIIKPMLWEIEDLNEKIRKCKKCRLWKTRTHVLRGEGNINAELMLVAQAPGENENQESRMFIGPSGKVLDELLRESDINRKEIYMTNLIKCMLPQYRKPKQDEIKACSQYLDKEIKLIDPAIISALGYYATRYIFEKYGIPMPKSKPEFPKICGIEIGVGSGRFAAPLGIKLGLENHISNIKRRVFFTG